MAGEGEMIEHIQQTFANHEAPDQLDMAYVFFEYNHQALGGQ